MGVVTRRSRSASASKASTVFSQVGVASGSRGADNACWAASASASAVSTAGTTSSARSSWKGMGKARERKGLGNDMGDLGWQGNGGRGCPLPPDFLG